MGRIMVNATPLRVDELEIGAAATPASMTVSAWNNGDHNPTGAGYVLRISQADRDAVFFQSWDHVLLELQTNRGPQCVAIPLSQSFCRKCSELRSVDVGRWLIAHGHATWPKGAPPTFRLRNIAGNRFALLDE
jgi:hypothetical protein